MEAPGYGLRVSEAGCALVTFLRISNRGTSMRNKVPDLFVKEIIIINSLDSKKR